MDRDFVKVRVNIQPFADINREIVRDAHQQRLIPFDFLVIRATTTGRRCSVENCLSFLFATSVPRELSFCKASRKERYC